MYSMRLIKLLNIEKEKDMKQELETHHQSQNSKSSAQISKSPRNVNEVTENL